MRADAIALRSFQIFARSSRPPYKVTRGSLDRFARGNTAQSILIMLASPDMDCGNASDLQNMTLGRLIVDPKP